LLANPVGATFGYVSASRPIVDVDHELAVLERAHVGLVHQVRIEALAERLRTVDGIPVTDNVNGLCGDRPTISLDGGMVLQLRLFWPARFGFAALCAIAWDDHIGWVVDVRSTAGDLRRLYAWHARLNFVDPSDRAS
jgi:hypothetical protein